MKRLTETQLRSIIRTEARRAVNESSRPHPGKYSLRFLLEDAEAGKIDPKLFPTKLSAVDPKLAPSLASKGHEDKTDEDDTAEAGKVSKPASSLKASQTTMDFEKFVGMAIQMMGKLGGFSDGPGGDLGAIVSSDGHIMDGHHRWAATLMVNPSANVGGLLVKLPGEQLVGVLNVWTVAHGGKGKPSNTNLDSLTGDSVAEKFKEMCSKGGKFLPTPEEILKAFQKQGFEDLDAAAEHVKKNWNDTSDSRVIEPWMPAKVDMPAIEPDQLGQVAKDINSGLMDINPPYSPEVSAAGDGEKEKKTPQNAGRLRNGHVVVERWQKLAGIIKG